MIGFLTCECHIYDVHSLKEKRSVLKRLIHSISKKFNVSVAETNYQDLWQRFEIGVVMISNNKTLVEKDLHKVLATIDSFTELQCTHYTIEWL
jgi:uncharacterized protein YlxP (DUF503 family)